jgi:hypothetical protein
MLHMLLTIHMVHSARVEVMDASFEQDVWRESAESQQLLRADRWCYKGMDKLRGNPEKAGQLLDIVSLQMACMSHMACMARMAHMANDNMRSRHSNQCGHDYRNGVSLDTDCARV